MKVLVTGGTGYLGSAIVRALLSRGHDAIAFARQPAGHGSPAATIRGDVRDRESLRGGCEGVDAIIHTAALVAQWRRDPTEFDAVNVSGLVNVLDVAREAGVRRVVYTSSFLARPPAGREAPLRLNDYQRTKVDALARARRAQAEGLPLVVVCPGVVYGPGADTEGNLVGRLLRDLQRRRLPGLIGATRIWSLSFVEDVALGHVLALERGAPGEQYALGGPNVPQGRLFEQASERLGCRAPGRLPFGLAAAVARLAEGWAELTGRPPVVTRGAVEIFKYDWPLDSGPAERALGYRITPLTQGLERTLSALMGPGRD